MNEKAFSFIIYCFRLIHIVVNRQLYRFAFQGFDGFCVEVVFADHDTEHVFIEPFVGECQVAVLDGSCSPAVFELPFYGFVVFVGVAGHQSHGVGRTALTGEDTGFFIHIQFHA